MDQHAERHRRTYAGLAGPAVSWGDAAAGPERSGREAAFESGSIFLFQSLAEVGGRGDPGSLPHLLRAPPGLEGFHRSQLLQKGTDAQGKTWAPGIGAFAQPGAKLLPAEPDSCGSPGTPPSPAAAARAIARPPGIRTPDPPGQEVLGGPQPPLAGLGSPGSAAPAGPGCGSFAGAPPSSVAPPASAVPSVGSDVELHSQGDCKPCAMVLNPKGCKWGSNCNHCHLPHQEVPRRPGKRKRTQAERLVARLLRAVELGHDVVDQPALVAIASLSGQGRYARDLMKKQGMRSL